MGYDVEIYADPHESDQNCYSSQIEMFNSAGSVKWCHYYQFDMERAVDVFIAWRYSLSLVYGDAATKRFIWLHDLVPLNTIPASVLPQVCSCTFSIYCLIPMEK